MVREDKRDPFAVSDTDSEPDDVGFGESKEKTLQRVKQATDQIQSSKNRIKLKRKEREDLYKRQKVRFKLS